MDKISVIEYLVAVISIVIVTGILEALGLYAQLNNLSAILLGFFLGGGIYIIVCSTIGHWARKHHKDHGK